MISEMHSVSGMQMMRGRGEEMRNNSDDTKVTALSGYVLFLQLRFAR